LPEGTAGFRIFEKDLIHKNIDFDFKKALEAGEKPLVKSTKQKKYYDNPAPNWGPKPKATGK
jgi:hypothetical protein